jgi:hypothetical protein
MPTLRAHRKAEFLPNYQSLPPTVQEKVCGIEVLYERAMLYLGAREGAPAGVPDFNSYLRDVYENRVKGAKKDHEDEPPEGGSGGAYYLGLEYEYWIEILGDSRYRPPTDLVHLAYMLAALWIYWINWPYDRRIFEVGNKISLRDAALGTPPPSAPSFEATLDRSLVWLASAVGVETANIQHWGEKKEGFALLNLKKKTDAAVKKAKVIEIYHISSKIKVGMKLNTVSKVIKAVFKERQGRSEIPKSIDTPSHYQITRYLEEDGIVNRDFKPVGRFQIKQT